MEFINDNQELIRASQNGDRHAMETLIKFHAEAVHAFIFSVMRDRSIVEDLAQETFLRAILAIDKYESRAPFRAWLFRIAVNLCRDEFRRRKIRRFLSLDNIEHVDDVKDRNGGPLSNLERKETVQAIERALQILPESLRMVIVLRDLQDMTYEEIAKILKWRMGTVKSRLFRARKLLSESVKKDLED